MPRPLVHDHSHLDAGSPGKHEPTAAALRLLINETFDRQAGAWLPPSGGRLRLLSKLERFTRPSG